MEKKSALFCSSCELLCFSVVAEDFNINAVMRLNQYRPGLEYRLISQSGPVHEPVFTMAVDLNGKTYEATGPSKRAAKLNVATKVQMSVLFTVINKNIACIKCVISGFPTANHLN